MMPELPHALGCPDCPYYVEVSTEDADASLSELGDHVFARHANYQRDQANEILARAVPLTASGTVNR